MKHPTEEECRRLHDRFHVPGNVREHCSIVAQISRFLGTALSESGIKVDLDALYSGGLLHDLFRFVDFRDIEKNKEADVQVWMDVIKKYPGKRHPEVAYEFLKSTYPEFALMILKHGYRAIADENMQPFSWEEKILTYADKRVAHNRIVSLKERFREGFERWLSYHPEAEIDMDTKKALDERYYNLEEELFRNLDITPGSVTKETIKNGQRLL